MRYYITLIIAFLLIPNLIYSAPPTPEGTIIKFGSLSSDTPSHEGEVAIKWDDPAGTHWSKQADTTVFTVDYKASPFVDSTDTETIYLKQNQSEKQPFTITNKGNGPDTFSTRLFFESFDGSTSKTPDQTTLAAASTQNGTGTFTINSKGDDKFDTAFLVVNSARTNVADTYEYRVRFTNPQIRLNRFVYGDTAYTLQDGGDTAINNDTYSLRLSAKNTGNIPVEFKPEQSNYVLFNEQGDTITRTFLKDEPSDMVLNEGDTRTVVYTGTLPDSGTKEAIGPVKATFDTSTLFVRSKPDSEPIAPSSLQYNTNTLYDWSQMFIQPSQDNPVTVQSVDNIVEVNLPRNKYPDKTKFTTTTNRNQLGQISSCVQEADDNIAKGKRYPSLDTSTVQVQKTNNASNDAALTVNLKYDSSDVPDDEKIRQRMYVLDEKLCRWRLAQEKEKQVIRQNTKTVQAKRPGLSVFRVLVAPIPKHLRDVTVAPNPFRPNDGNPHTGKPYQFSDDESGVFFKGVPNNTTIKIVDIHGRTVKRINASQGGTIRWKVRNGHGEKVASDVYLYRVKHNGSTKTGKIAVIR